MNILGNVASSSDANTVRMSREFKVSVEALYRACSSPIFFRRTGADLKTGAMDFGVGGAYDFKIPSSECAPEGDFVRGEFKEIEINKKIVFTWFSLTNDGPTGETLVTLTFDDLGEGKSRLNLVHEGFTSEYACKAHEQGWTGVMDSVERRPLLGLKESQIKYRQWFAAAPEVVYDLMCTSEGLDKWFCTGAVVDLKNMRCQYQWKNWGPDRKTHGSDGAILEATHGKRFVFRWGSRPVTTIEFDFLSENGGTRVNVFEYGYDEDDRESKALMMQCASGWGEAMALAKFCLEQGVNCKNSWPKING